MVRRIRPLAGRASLIASVMDILKLSLVPWNDAMLSAHALRTQRTTDTLGIALPTPLGFGITAGAGILYPVLRRITPTVQAWHVGSLPSFDMVFSQDRFSQRKGLLSSYQCVGTAKSFHERSHGAKE